MRHRANRKNFGRDFNHKKALIRNLVISLVEHGRIKTTLQKAKELRRHADRAITIGKRGGLNSVRILLSKYPNKKMVSEVVDNLSQKFKDRNGGYTRIIKIGNRLGDNAQMAFIEWVDYLGVSKGLVKADKPKKEEASKAEASENEEVKKKGSTKKNKSRKAQLIAKKKAKRVKKTQSKSDKPKETKSKDTKGKKQQAIKQKATSKGTKSTATAKSKKSKRTTKSKEVKGKETASKEATVDKAAKTKTSGRSKFGFKRPSIFGGKGKKKS